MIYYAGGIMLLPSTLNPELTVQFFLLPPPLSLFLSNSPPKNKKNEASNVNAEGVRMSFSGDDLWQKCLSCVHLAGCAA